jgi:hypothetical protein
MRAPTHHNVASIVIHPNGAIAIALRNECLLEKCGTLVVAFAPRDERLCHAMNICSMR